MFRIGWFSTGRGEGSRGLLRFVQDRILRGQLDAQIQFVFSNRAPGEAEGSDEYFQLVTGYDIPLHTLSSSQFRRDRGGSLASHRDEFDQQVMTQLRDYQVDELASLNGVGEKQSFMAVKAHHEGHTTRSPCACRRANTTV